MLLLLMLALYAVLLGGVLAYLRLLLARRSTWPANEAFAATIMTVAAFAFQSRGEFSWAFDAWRLPVQIPLLCFAVVLWIYMVGRTIRGIRLT